MANTTPVNAQITDAVTQSNVKTTTETPADAVAQAINNTTHPTPIASTQPTQGKNNAAGNNSD